MQKVILFHQEGHDHVRQPGYFLLFPSQILILGRNAHDPIYVKGNEGIFLSECEQARGRL